MTVQQFAALLLLPLLVSCSASKKVVETMDPIMHFDPAYIDLGVVKKGESPTMIFPFVNSGKEDIEIELATGCQCSEIFAPVDQVFKPGEKGTISVIFHSDLEKDLGAQTKIIDVLLKQIEPETGYQIIKEVKYSVVLEE